MKILQLLRQPYPIEASVQERLTMMAITSLFVPLFLAVFQPFGIHTIEEAKFWFIAGYGGVTLVAFFCNAFALPALFPVVFSDNRWTVAKQFCYLIWYLVSIAAGNVLYTHLFGYTDISLTSFTGFLLATIAVGFFPVSFLTLLSYSSSQRHYHREAARLDIAVQEHHTIEHAPSEYAPPATEKKEEEVSLCDEEGREVMRLQAAELLYIKAADNYVEVLTVERVSTLIRTTLKRIEEAGLAESWYRCHRSYIVNINAIQHISGNSQGLRLIITEDLPLIPVARGKSKELRERIEG